jgi:hypothetical protein
MKRKPDLADMFIIAFIAMVFITGVVVVYKFMRGGKKK